MAKANGALFSLEAHGSIKKNLTYTKRKSGQKVRSYNKPTGAPSGAQRAKRRLTEFLVAEWQAMSEANKDIWRDDETGKRLGITGYQYFLKKSQENMLDINKLVLYYSFNTWQTTGVINEAGDWAFATKAKYDVSDYPVEQDSMSKKFGQGTYFDGLGANFSRTNDLTENMGEGDFYLEAWIKPENLTGNKRIYQKGANAGINGIRFGTKNNNIWLILGNDSTFVNTTGTKTLELNKWYMISVSIDRDTGAQLYVNGEEDGSLIDISSVIGDINPVVTGYIGDYAEAFKGTIDEVCAYKRALSADEIAIRYRFGTKKVKK